MEWYPLISYGANAYSIGLLHGRISKKIGNGIAPLLLHTLIVAHRFFRQKARRQEVEESGIEEVFAVCAGFGWKQDKRVRSVMLKVASIQVVLLRQTNPGI